MAQKKKKEIKDTERFIEIPFGAFDSETIGWTYTIPEGLTAKIEDGKIIVEQKAESEDERIRKEIIAFLIEHDENGYVLHSDRERWVAWLEKQKEQKTIEDVVKEVTKDKESATEFLKSAGIMDENGNLAEQYRSDRQKPAEWSEEYSEEDLRTRFAFYTYKDEDDVLYLSNVFVEETSRNKGFGTKILQAAEKVAETIGAIRICLKVKQDSLANAWYRKR